MNKDVQNIIDLLAKHAEAIKDEPSREVLRLYKYNIVPSNMGGLWDTAYTCQVLAEGDMRQLNAYMLFSQIRLTESGQFSLDQMKALFLDTVPLSANFLATCGFEELWDDVQKVMNVFDKIETLAEYKQVLDMLCYYVTNLHNWVHFFFPWYVGDLFRMCHEKDVKEMQAMWDWTNQTEH